MPWLDLHHPAASVGTAAGRRVDEPVTDGIRDVLEELQVAEAELFLSEEEVVQLAATELSLSEKEVVQLSFSPE